MTGTERPQPQDEPPPEHAPTGRGRLRAALRPRSTRGQVIAAVLCGVLGFAAAVQVRANRDADLEGQRQTDLVRILDDVSDRSARLQAEAAELERTKERLTGGTSGSRGALEEARDRADTMGILAGTLPATGPGLELTISDPKGQVAADVLLDAMQELRNAGAEAMEISQVGGPSVRVVASTHLADAEDGAVEVDDVALESPYRFVVIGDATTMAAALDIPGGVLDVLRQRGAQGAVAQRESVTISSLRATPAPEYARPAPETTGGSD
jgi:uncharacterized protein YlxW (UPF0749 family)